MMNYSKKQLLAHSKNISKYSNGMLQGILVCPTCRKETMWLDEPYCKHCIEDELTKQFDDAGIFWANTLSVEQLENIIEQKTKANTGGTER